MESVAEEKWEHDHAANDRMRDWQEKTDSKRDPGGIFPRDRQGKTWINMEIKAVKFNNA